MEVVAGRSTLSLPWAEVCARKKTALTTLLRTNQEALQAMREESQKLIAAFGEPKSAADWLRDSRCRVNRKTITNRILKGLAPEEAITAELTGHLAKGKSAA